MEGGFRHFEQSVRVVERLENDGRGLNLTAQTRDGILTHTRGALAQTLEGQLVRIADRVAYISHDIDDAERAGVMQESDVPADLRCALGDSRQSRIDRLVTAVVEHSGERIGMDPATEEAFERLHSFMYEAVYYNPVAKSEERKVDGLIEQMFTHFVTHPERLPAELSAVCEAEGAARAACDFIAGMTDNYALDIYHQLFIPRSWEIKLTV
jgi:dGTPase